MIVSCIYIRINILDGKSTKDKTRDRIEPRFPFWPSGHERRYIQPLPLKSFPSFFVPSGFSPQEGTTHGSSAYARNRKCLISIGVVARFRTAAASDGSPPVTRPRPGCRSAEPAAAQARKSQSITLSRLVMFTTRLPCKGTAGSTARSRERCWRVRINQSQQG